MKSNTLKFIHVIQNNNTSQELTYSLYFILIIHTKNLKNINNKINSNKNILILIQYNKITINIHSYTIILL